MGLVMTLEWSQAKRLRDDPYHEWERQARGSDDEDGICPVVVSLRGDTPQEVVGNIDALLAVNDKQDGKDADAETIRKLLSALGLRDLPNRDQFIIAAYEVEHLQESHDRLVGSEVESIPDYSRIFVLYVQEGILFGQSVGRFRDNRYFEILYIGRPILNIFRNDKFLPAREIPKGIIERKLVCMTTIDDSLAILNDAFWKQEGAQAEGDITLFQEVWVQEQGTLHDGQLVTGPRITKEQIDGRILQTLQGLPDIHAYAADVRPQHADWDYPMLDMRKDQHQPLAFGRSHGTHVASVAVNAYRHSGGSDEDLLLYGVSLPTEIIRERSRANLAAYVLTAIRQAMLWCDDQIRKAEGTAGINPVIPLIINFSVGYHAGPKDGTGALERIVEVMLESRNAMFRPDGTTQARPTTLFISMGNAYPDRTTAKFTLNGEEELESEVDWVLLPDDRTASYVEIYAKPVDGSAPVEIEVELVPPVSTVPTKVFSLDPGRTHTALLKDDNDNLFAMFGSLPVEDRIGSWPPLESQWSWRGFLGVAPTASLTSDTVVPHGRWRLKVRNAGEAAAEVWMFVQSDDTPGTYRREGRQSFFDHENGWTFHSGALNTRPEGGYITRKAPITAERSASNLASIRSDHVIVVGAGQAKLAEPDEVPDLEAATYASAGPRDGRSTPGPDKTVLADRGFVARGIYAAGTLSGTRRAMNGSSVAAPTFAGIEAALATGADGGFFQDCGNASPKEVRRVGRKFSRKIMR